MLHSSESSSEPVSSVRNTVKSVQQIFPLLSTHSHMYLNTYFGICSKSIIHEEKLLSKGSRGRQGYRSAGKLRQGMSAYVIPITRERKTSKTSGYFPVGSMFQQSQGQRPLELITGKHGFVFSKYKLEAKDIILDAKKVRAPFKSPKSFCFFFSFLSHF